MLRGLSVSVEMNGDLILDTADMLTWSLVVSGVHCTVTVTSVSTVSGSVTVQVRVCEVPSYSGPLGTLRATAGVGTVTVRQCGHTYIYTHNTHIHHIEHTCTHSGLMAHTHNVERAENNLQLTVTGTASDVEVMSSAAAGETSVP